ncbi:MAG: hypothetical protein HY053_05945 [Proteobacteria bacterium]|nr:hypothetical protein [Pseudomonadota bacterium]
MPNAYGLVPFFLAVLMAAPAFAEDGLGRFGAWKALRVVEKKQTVCYMVAHPIEKPEPKKPVKTGKAKPALPREAYVMVTFRPGENLAPVFSYGAGVILKEGSEALLLNLNKEKFSLFTSGEGAWARASATDQAIVKMMQKGGAMAVVAVSAKGGKLADKFDLKGAAEAYKKIAGACGIP